MALLARKISKICGSNATSRALNKFCSVCFLVRWQMLCQAPRSRCTSGPRKSNNSIWVSSWASPRASKRRSFSWTAKLSTSTMRMRVLAVPLVTCQCRTIEAQWAVTMDTALKPIGTLGATMPFCRKTSGWASHGWFAGSSTAIWFWARSIQMTRMSSSFHVSPPSWHPASKSHLSIKKTRTTLTIPTLNWTTAAVAVETWMITGKSHRKSANSLQATQSRFLTRPRLT